MNLKLLDKYIFSQVLSVSLGCIIVFMIIWIMPEIFLRAVQRTISGEYTIEAAASILVNELPKVLHIALPVGMLLGALFTFEKMSREFEITVMRSCGISFFRITAPVLILSAAVSVFTLFIGAKLLPYSACRLKELKGSERISQFVFPVKKPAGNMDKIIIVPHFDSESIKDAVVLNFYNEAEEGSSLLSSILISDFVKYTGGKWTINQAKKYIISKDGIFSAVEKVKDTEVLSGLSAENAFKLMKYSVYRDRELTNAQILEYIKLLKSENMDDEYRFMLNKYIHRFVHAFMCIIFAVLGCLLGFSKPREQKVFGMLMAAGVIFGYYITIPFFDLMAEKAVLPPVIASAAAPVLLLVLIAVLKKVKDL